MNRISIRGAAVATAMASTTLVAGVAAFADSPSAQAAMLRSGHRTAGAPVESGEQTRFETAALRPTTSPTARPSRASRTVLRSSLPPRELGRLMAARRGWSGAQWTCLDKLWMRESEWRVHARNSSSGAYGIPQSLPARKMARMGSDWRTSARTQISWGLWYIDASYGTPCRAWRHSQSHGYY